MAEILLAFSQPSLGTLTATGQLTIGGYAADERSADRSEPEELFLFNLMDTTYWSYTSSDYDITYGGRNYTAVLIKRSDILLNANSLKTKIEIEVDITNTFAQNFVNEVPEGVIKLTIYRRHKQSNFEIYWQGYILGVGFRKELAIIVAGLKDKSLSRYGLMRKFQRTCPYSLYSTRCTILESDPSFQISGTIVSIDGVTITADEFSNEVDGWLVGGKFKTDSGSCNQRIVYHVGTTIKIARKVLAITTGDTFIAYAGCDGLKATCKTKFNNKLNFGGQPYIPSKNPFGGTAIAYK